MLMLSFTIGGVVLGALACIRSYRNQSHSQRIVIPSLFLLKKFPQKHFAEKRTIPPRLCIELLFLILLGHSLYMLLDKESSKVELVLLDNSLSQSATEAKNSDTRLVKGIKSFLEASHQADSFKLMTLPQKSKESFKELPVLSFSQLQEELKKQKASTVPNSLATDFLENIKNEPFEIISLITDKDIQFENLSLTSNAIRVFQGFEKSSNIYIGSVSYSSFEQGLRLHIQIAQSREGSSKAELHVSMLKSGSDLGKKQRVELHSEKPAVIDYDILQAIPQNEVIKIEVKDLLLHDSISTDNVWYLKPDALLTNKIDVVSNESQAAQLVKTIPQSLRGAVSQYSPETYKESESDAKISLYYKAPLPQKISRPTLAVLPTSFSSGLDAIEISSQSIVTSWNEKSFLTTYVQFDSIVIPRAIIFNQPAWAVPVISNKAGALLLEGIKDGHKIIVSGIELLPFDANRKSAVDVLLLNILTSLQEKSVTQGDRLYRNSEYNSLNCVPTNVDCVQDTDILEKGVYEVVTQNRKNELIAVNNVNANESDTYRQKKITLDLKNYKPKQTSIDLSSMPWSLYAALFLLCMDMLIIAIFKKELRWDMIKKESAQSRGVV